MVGSVVPNTSSKHNANRWPWAIAAVLITALLVGGYLVYRIIHLPGDTASALAEAFRPHVEYKTEINGAIRSLKNDPKLVVLTATIDAEIHRSSSTSALWIYWGTTTVDVKANENKVQFYVPVDDIGTQSFEYDETHKILTVRARPPILDEEVVEVQTDPQKVFIATSNGWAKIDRFSGAPMREEAMHELRGAVIQAAKQPAQYELLELKAMENAKTEIRRLLEPLTQTLKPDVKLEVEFEQ